MVKTLLTELQYIVGPLNFVNVNQFVPILLTKIILTVFWDSQRGHMTEFWEADNTVNSARYIETIKNLRRRVCRVRRSTSLHDNARPHTARATIDALETLKFEVLSHPPYRPDLAPSVFHFFPHL